MVLTSMGDLIEVVFPPTNSSHGFCISCGLSKMIIQYTGLQ